MNRYQLSSEVELKYRPIIQGFIDTLQATEDGDDNELELVLSDTKLNPYTLGKLLEDFGYQNTDQDDNGWQMDFWITYTKKGFKPLCVAGTGITFELKLTKRL